MNNKLKIESAILGSIIYGEGFSQVAHILSGKNFTSSAHIKHRELYNLICSMYPDRPIDAITISESINQLPGETTELHELIFTCGSGYTRASTNLIYWAILLLQIDLSEKYKSSLIDWKNNRDRDFEYTESGALQEIIETVDTNQDIFEIIEKSIQYFGQMKMSYEHGEATQFYKDVSDKGRNIQKVNSIHVALRYLFSVTQCADVEVKDQCEKFASAISDMITTGQTNPRYTEAVNIIYQ